MRELNGVNFIGTDHILERSRGDERPYYMHKYPF